MGVNHRGFDVAVTEEFLDCADIVAVFDEVRGKGMPEGMAGGAF